MPPRGSAVAQNRAVPYRAWLWLAVILSIAATLLLLSGPAEPWLFVVDAALLVALLGFLRAWRSQRRS